MCKLTVEEAYQAMLNFLENLYNLTSSDELAGFLGGMTILKDGKPADAAVWEDWLSAVNKVIQHRLG